MKDLKDMSIEELWQLFPIILKDHNPHYKLWYEEEIQRLTHLLNELNICRASHIGSTAVEGLIAKPIVDILLELPSGYNAKNATQLLQSDGWLLMQADEEQQTIDLNKGYTPSGFEEKVYHLHVKPFGDWGELYFRDYLRQDHDVARQYGQLKLNLKNQFKHNRDAYTDAKSAFVAEFTQKARLKFGDRYTP